MNNGIACISKNEKTIAVGHRKGNLYEFNFNTIHFLDSKNTAYNVNSQNHIDLWHQRFSHMSEVYLNKLPFLVSGMDFKNNKLITRCKVCIQAKKLSIPFKGTRTRAKRSLKFVHRDACRPITPVTCQRDKYFVTFIDDYTHFIYTYLLKAKSDVIHMLKKYVAIAIAQFGCCLAKLHYDNSGEYICKSLDMYCEYKGIQLEFTTPYIPQLNLHTEKINRTLTKKCRSMLLDSGVSKELWGKCKRSTIYLKNRSPTTALEDHTPADMWFSKKPDISGIRILDTLHFYLNQSPREKI